MLTILAWIVFIGMTVWNVAFWSVAFVSIMEKKIPANKKRMTVEILLTLGLWFIPGVYLFGWY
jgi:hypothetical protein